ncbi:MAG: Uma2 family endonuclease [Saprospiraceae bacterium]|nr:Uma2 family endonuclease [Saprospiraceae bacterium]
MSTAISQAEPKPKVVVRQPRRITLQEFLQNYSNKEDGYKYEWNNGLVEKTITMNQQQANFFFLLLDFFQKTSASKNGGGLITETDMFTSSVQMRRPDIAFYSGAQRLLMKKGENQVAPWLAEVISPSDNADKINEKLEEYFKAGVQVVWHIFPASLQVYVYTAPDKVTICRGKTLCSGAPALPDFEISAECLFA